VVLTVAVYFGFNLFYAMMDLTGRPAFLYKYKIQEDEPVRPANSCAGITFPPQIDPEKYKLAVIRSVLNVAFINVPILLLMYHTSVWRGMSFGYDGIPDFFTTVWQFTVILLIEEVCFYYSHR